MGLVRAVLISFWTLLLGGVGASRADCFVDSVLVGELARTVLIVFSTVLSCGSLLCIQLRKLCVMMYHIIVME